MFKSPNAGMVWVRGTLKTFKKYILKLLNNMQRSVLLRVVRASSFCCLTIKKLRERRGLGNLRHFKDQPTEKSGIVYDNLFLSSQACVANKLKCHRLFRPKISKVKPSFFAQIREVSNTLTRSEGVSDDTPV